MHIHRISAFKNPALDLAWFENWVAALETLNGRTYRRFDLHSALGHTRVWGLNTGDDTLDALVIFPGARTSALFWDIDRGLDNLGDQLRIFLVETNGLPNPSAGNTPDIRSNGYGIWAAGVLEQLGLSRAFVAGASFGGLVCMKLCIARPEKVQAAFLLNPGCLQPFSLTPKNLFYNLLPILYPSRRNVQRFLNNAVFGKPQHQLSAGGEALLEAYEIFALKRYRDYTQKPYFMRAELEQVRTDTYLLAGGRDLLFPPAISINNAVNKIQSLKKVLLFDHAGHGIETYPKALQALGELIRKHQARKAALAKLLNTI